MPNQPTFDPKMFYTLSPSTLPNSTLNTRAFQGTLHPPQLMVQRTQASENWQLFYQAGHYFIRNFDFGPGWQLGFADEEGGGGSGSSPLLLPQNGGSKGQRWIFIKGDGDGWEIANEMVGNGSRYVVEGGGGMVPRMRMGDGEGDGGAVWRVVENPSAVARNPLKDESLKRVEGGGEEDDVQRSSLSTSISPSSTIISATSPGLAVGSSTSTSTNTSAPPIPPPATPKHLNHGEIAAISIAAVLFLSALIFALYFFLRSKSKNRNAHNINSNTNSPSSADVLDDPYARTEKDGQMRIELAVPAPELSCRDADPSRWRSELDAKGVEDGNWGKSRWT